jgi:hypothetical protein
VPINPGSCPQEFVERQRFPRTLRQNSYLCCCNEKRSASCEPNDDRFRDETNDEAKSQHSRHHLQDTNQERQRERKFCPLNRLFRNYFIGNLARDGFARLHDIVRKVAPQDRVNF